MNFKKTLSFMLLLSASFANSQCMEKKDKDEVHLTKNVFLELELCIPSSSYLIKRYNFCHYILRELYKEYSGSYPTEKTSNQSFKDFRLQLIKFLQPSVNFTIYESSSFNSLTMILVNSYRCLDENNNEIKTNIYKLINYWNSFLKRSLQSSLEYSINQFINKILDNQN